MTGMGTFYVVATPIGNMEDVTLRALRVLAEADAIVCEDTRVTKKLLVRHGISKPTLAYHARSSARDLERVLSLLGEGKTLALVTDAGTPGISDPGPLLVSSIRRRLPEVCIAAVPGASALAAALSVSGLDVSEFVFLGFLPHKKGRQSLLAEMVASRRATVFFESTHRIMRTLEDLQRLLSAEDPARTVAISTELTKIHEHTFVGTPAEALAFFLEDPKRQKGEFVLILEGRR